MLLDVGVGDVGKNNGYKFVYNSIKINNRPCLRRIAAGPNPYLMLSLLSGLLIDSTAKDYEAFGYRGL